MALSDMSMGQSEGKPPITVKGVRDGLLFLLDEHCSFESLVAALQELLFDSPSQLLTGPMVAVSVDYGSRTMTPEESRQLLQMFLLKDNFSVREWGPHTSARRTLFANASRESKQNIHKGTVRAGQQIYYEGDVVVIGDVNPGGEIIATGDVYVLGRLRGIAHAGSRGNERAVIAAAEFAPLQLRIAGRVSRPPEVDGKVLNTPMEFAYVRDDGMAVDKLMYLYMLKSEQESILQTR